MTDTNTIDPTKPLHPLIVSYPVPGVCTAQWEEADWDRWIAANGVSEALVIESSALGRMVAAGRNAAGNILYTTERFGM